MSETAMKPFVTWYDGKPETKKTESWYSAKDAAEMRVSHDARGLREDGEIEEHRVHVECQDGEVKTFDVDIEIVVTARAQRSWPA